MQRVGRPVAYVGGPDSAYPPRTKYVNVWDQMQEARSTHTHLQGCRVFADVCTYNYCLGMVLLGLACQGLGFSAETCLLGAVDLSQPATAVGKPLCYWKGLTISSCNPSDRTRPCLSFPPARANTARWWKAWQSVLTGLQRNLCVPCGHLVVFV